MNTSNGKPCRMNDMFSHQPSPMFKPVVAAACSRRCHHTLLRHVHDAAAMPLRRRSYARGDSRQRPVAYQICRPRQIIAKCHGSHRDISTIQTHVYATGMKISLQVPPLVAPCAESAFRRHNPEGQEGGMQAAALAMPARQQSRSEDSRRALLYSSASSRRSQTSALVSEHSWCRQAAVTPCSERR
jgi:hypothetical protein